MKKLKYLVFVLIISLFVIFGVSYATREQMKDFSNDDITMEYDKSWKLKKKDNGVNLEHRKTGSELDIQVMILDDNFMDIDLKDIIEDIINSVEIQNSEYYLIGKESYTGSKYDEYSYLYEKDNEQAMVRIIKKDCKLVLAYYEAGSEYYDIVLDSVDTILESLEIKTGEKIPNS